MDVERETPEALGEFTGPHVDHLSNLAARKLGKPGWRWCKSEAATGGFVLTGAVPRLLERGPRKGQPTWAGVPLERVILTRAEVDAEVRGEGARREEQAAHDAATHKRASVARRLRELAAMNDAQRSWEDGRTRTDACGDAMREAANLLAPLNIDDAKVCGGTLEYRMIAGMRIYGVDGARRVYEHHCKRCGMTGTSDGSATTCDLDAVWGSGGR